MMFYGHDKSRNEDVEAVYMTIDTNIVETRLSSVTEATAVFNWGDGITEVLDIDTRTVNSHTYTDNITYHEVSVVVSDIESFLCSISGVVNLNISRSASLSSLYCEGNNLTSLNISSNTALATLLCNNNNLNSDDINTHLSMLVANGLSNGYYNSQNQTISAPPTGQGIIDKAILVADGWTVLTD